jgi:hypothetical protein
MVAHHEQIITHDPGRMNQDVTDIVARLDTLQVPWLEQYSLVSQEWCAIQAEKTTRGWTGF